MRKWLKNVASHNKRPSSLVVSTLVGVRVDMDVKGPPEKRVFS